MKAYIIKIKEFKVESSEARDTLQQDASSMRAPGTPHV